MAKDLNRAQLIGRLTRDPELRYTPNGSAVCSFGLATNRTWTTDTGEKKEEVDFHNLVAWRKLAEICSQYLTKGKRIYVEGRLTTRTWTGQGGQQKSKTEIVMDDMIMLDGKGSAAGAGVAEAARAKPEVKTPTSAKAQAIEDEEAEVSRGTKPKTKSTDEEVSPDDIPF